MSVEAPSYSSPEIVPPRGEAGELWESRQLARKHLALALRKFWHGPLQEADREDMESEAWLICHEVRHNHAYDDSQKNSYLQQRIKGLIFDHYRRNDLLTRDQRANVRKLESVKNKLREKLRHEPDSEELAEALGMTLEKYHTLVESAYVQKKEGLSFSVSGADMPDVASEHDVETDVMQKRLLLRAFDQLNERERDIVTSILAGHEFKTIGERLGITESRVSQIVSGIKQRWGAKDPEKRAAA